GDFSFATAGAPAAPVPPTTGHQRPIGHWRFSEWTGSLTGDASGSGYTGGLVNGPAWETGVTDRALSFDGVNDYVTVAHAAPLDAYPITVAAWIRTTSTGLGGVINKYLPSSMNGYQIFMNGGNLCAWYFKDSSSFVWDGTSCTLATPGANDGRWHHVAFVVDASGGRLYLDGTLKASRAWTGTPGPATTTTDLSFGRYPNIATPYWPGALDELRLYGRSLSPGEIATEAGGI
ncbi:MAG TPA: LamG domain-containing protein, partial [Candidatus Polarisedimenticolia bacterium]